MMSIFTKDAERLDRWLRLYIHHRNLFQRGKSEIAAIRSLVSLQSLMVFWLFARDLMPWLPIWIVTIIFPLLMAFRTVLYWVVGAWWDREKVFDKEADWNNNRNPVSKALNEQVLKGKGIEG